MGCLTWWCLACCRTPPGLSRRRRAHPALVDDLRTSIAWFSPPGCCFLTREHYTSNKITVLRTFRNPVFQAEWSSQLAQGQSRDKSGYLPPGRVPTVAPDLLWGHVRCWNSPKSGVTKRPPFLLKRYLPKRLPSHDGYAWIGSLLPHQYFPRAEPAGPAHGHSRLSPCARDRICLASETYKVGYAALIGCGSV